MNLRSKILTVAISALALTAAAVSTNAQNVNRQYRQWQQAQAEAQRECGFTFGRRDARQCQRAQERAQREYNDYVRASNGVNRNVYGNYGGSTVYNPSTGQTYRVYRNGQYYETSYRGYELLRQAVNAGYQQGYRQGQIDRRYGRGYNYYGNNVYSQGMFGYQSYVARDQYQYYFQQGFQRGYEDGYNNTFRYGTRSGSTFNILSNVLGTILNLANQ
jgi:flagellar biosynthesis/type III secretory pathway protein FliH